MFDYNTIDETVASELKEGISIPIEIEGKSIDELMTEYEKRIIGVHMLSRPEGYQAMIDWLRNTDFYRAPASSKYHESFVGGLLTHTIKVYNCTLDLLKSPTFADVNTKSAALASLCHDWCKIGLYESYQKNVKNEKTGEWEKVTAFRRNMKGIPMGHGATSMFIASHFFSLSNEEALAIRWHMGEYNVAPNEMDELHLANSKYPLCYLIQFADRAACCDWLKI